MNDYTIRIFRSKKISANWCDDGCDFYLPFTKKSGYDPVNKCTLGCHKDRPDEPFCSGMCPTKPKYRFGMETIDYGVDGSVVEYTVKGDVINGEFVFEINKEATV